MRRPVVYNDTAFALPTPIWGTSTAGASYTETSNLLAPEFKCVSIIFWGDPEGTPCQIKLEVTNAIVYVDADSIPESASNTAQASGSIDHPVEHIVSGLQDEEEFAASSPNDRQTETSGTAIYYQYHAPIVARISKAVSFASIDFSKSIIQLFASPFVWRGLV